MRITTLAVLLFFVPHFTVRAAASCPEQAFLGHPDIVSYRLAAMGDDGVDVDAPAGKKPLYTKGKGTWGLVAGLLLGPIGLLGAYLFSRNRAVRKKAISGSRVGGTGRSLQCK